MNNRRSRTGFTLVEVLVALFIALVVLAVMFAFERFQLNTLETQSEQVELQNAARSIVDIVARDLRQAGTNPACGGVEAIPMLHGGERGPNRFRLRVLRDLTWPVPDGDTADSQEDVTYFWEMDNRVLCRREGAGSGPCQADEVLVEGVDPTGSGFRYFDNAGNESAPGENGLTAAQRQTLRSIRIDVALSTQSGRTGETLVGEAATLVDLRNRFFVATNQGCTPLPTPYVPTPEPTPMCGSGGSSCGAPGDNPCCTAFQCTNGTCQVPCGTLGGACGGSNPPCCTGSGLVCQGNRCQQCRSAGASCGGNAPACCAPNTCQGPPNNRTCQP